MNFFFVIVACFQAAASGAGAQDHHVTDACTKPVRDHSLMQRGVRGLDHELRALSQTVRGGVHDQGIVDTIVEEVGSSISGDDTNSSSRRRKSSKKHHHHGGNHSNSTSKQTNGSNHTKTNSSNNSQTNGSFSNGGCVKTHWVSDHDGQLGTIIDIKNHHKFFKVFFKDQLEEWIPKEYLSPTACPKVKVHDCVKVDWVSEHDGELGTVVDIQKHHTEQIGRVKFADTQEEWIPLDSMNYSFKTCPQTAGHNASHHSNSSASKHNHSDNASSKKHHKNQSNSSAHNHTNSSSHKHSNSSAHHKHHKNQSNSSAHNHSNSSSHKHSNSSSHHKHQKNQSNSSAHNHTNSSSHKQSNASAAHNHSHKHDNKSKSSGHTHTNSTSHKHSHGKTSHSSAHNGSNSTKNHNNQSNKTTKHTDKKEDKKDEGGD